MAIEEEKRKKYNPDVFANERVKTSIPDINKDDIDTKEDTELIVYKEETIFLKIKNYFKDILNRIFGNMIQHIKLVKPKQFMHTVMMEKNMKFFHYGNTL